MLVRYTVWRLVSVPDGPLRRELHRCPLKTILHIGKKQRNIRLQKATDYLGRISCPNETYPVNSFSDKFNNTRQTR